MKSVRLAEVKADVAEAEKNGARLQMELARIAPHVPRVFDEGEDGEFYYFVMEYVAGRDLSKVLEENPLPENRAIAIAIQLFDFLARLHSFTSEIGGRKKFGIIHGDIKPENIRLQDGDRVRVIDFGIAKQLSLSRSYTKNQFGSLPYLPPERLEHGMVDIHSDLWAAAVVLYSMVSGRMPYAGTTEDTVIRKIQTHDIASLPATCSRSLQWIIYKSLDFEIDRRFPTAAIFREHLEILRDGGSLDNVSQHSTPKSATTQPSQPAQPPPDPPQPEPAKARSTETRRTVSPSPQKAVQPPVSPRLRIPVAPGKVPGESDATQQTRRTRASVPPPPTVLQHLAPSPPRPAAPRRRRAGRLWVLPILLMALWGASEVFALLQARSLRRELAEANPDLTALWKRYQNADRWSLPGLGLKPAGTELRTALLQEADSIFQVYHREDLPSSRWAEAGDLIKKAVEIEAGDAHSQARLLYAQAQLDRTEVTKKIAETRQRQEEFEKIAGTFEEAAKLDPAWPDPYLGLVALYASPLRDLDRLRSALTEMKRRGLSPGPRSQELLAYACLRTAEDLMSEAAGDAYRTSSEQKLLREARKLLREAVSLYEDLPSSVKARERRDQAKTHLDRIAARLQ